jgi:hypothetical protein
LREALLDAGIVELRPVMITVGATVLGLIALVIHGGPLWEPLCYAQIGGLVSPGCDAAACPGNLFHLCVGFEAHYVGACGRSRANADR